MGGLQVRSWLRTFVSVMVRVKLFTGRREHRENRHYVLYGLTLCPIICTVPTFCFGVFIFVSVLVRVRSAVILGV